MQKDAAKLQRRQNKLDKMNASAALLEQEEKEVEAAVDASRPTPQTTSWPGTWQGKGAWQERSRDWEGKGRGSARRL